MDLETGDFEEQSLEDEELEDLSDFHTDEDDSPPCDDTEALDESSVPGVRKYKKSDQKARLEAAEAQINETNTLLKQLENGNGSDRDALKKTELLNRLESLKKEKTQARNAVNQHRRQIKLRTQFGNEKQKILEEKEREFAAMYSDAYDALSEVFCEYIHSEGCGICSARLLFSNLTFLIVESDKSFEESQKSPTPQNLRKRSKITANNAEEVQMIKKERTRNCLRAFRERQKLKVLGLDQRLNFLEESRDTFKRINENLGKVDKKLSLSNDEQANIQQPDIMNCVREFAATVGVPLPKYNIRLDTDDFLENFLDYLSETFMILIYHPVGFEEICEEFCSQCNEKTVTVSDFQYILQDLPAVEGVQKFEDVIESYQLSVENVEDCRKCMGEETLTVSRYFTMERTETKYLLVRVPNGAVLFPQAVEMIFKSPMELVFFITVTGQLHTPSKKIDGAWFGRLESGSWHVAVSSGYTHISCFDGTRYGCSYSHSNELNKHAAELEMLLDHVKNLNARVSDLGRAGPPGINGSPGFPGSKGEKGVSGLDGTSGKDGMQGIPGVKGDMGPIGPTGMKGEKGATGFPGQKGEFGAAGIPGLKGDTGIPGKIGEPGSSGLPGIKGEKGADGLPGTNGQSGAPGWPGSKGEDGLPGRPGSPGFPGKKGESGNSGVPGMAGLIGERGLPGAPGPQGMMGPIGPSGQIGLPGGKGEQGPPGFPGAKGDQGKDGLPGLPGWLVNDKGYCILALGNCPPAFTQIGAYQTHVDNYRFGDYSLVKSGGIGGNEESFALKVHACCR